MNVKRGRNLGGCPGRPTGAPGNDGPRGAYEHTTLPRTGVPDILLLPGKGRVWVKRGSVAGLFQTWYNRWQYPPVFFNRLFL